jgi:VCBS repeat-containing protein
MPLSGNLPGAADVDGDAVTYALGTNASNGNVVVNANGTFTYTPNANFNGPDSFTFTLSDGHGGSNTYNYDVTVTPVNDAPTSSPGSNSTAEDTALSATLPAATDVDGDSITYSLGANAANGNVVVNADGTFTYTPNANFNGSDCFTFTVSDGHGGSNTYSYGLTVTPVNDAPVGAGDSYSTAEDTALTIAAPGVLVNDSDVDGNALNSVLVTGPAHGSLTLNADGSFTYTPAFNYNGPDSFTYTPNDGSTDGNTVTVNLNVTPVNDAPTSANGSNSTQEDTALSASLPAASDVDGNPVSYALDTNAAHGNVVINANGTFTYTPTADYNGSDSFKFTVSDGQGGSNTYTYSLNVTPVADAVNDTATTNAGTAVTTSVLANDNFEGSPVVTNASNGTNGTVTFNGTSTTYVPNAGFSGADSYSYTVTSGGVTETATVNVTVNPPANSLFLRINVPGPEGQDALNFANFTVTIGSTVYHLSDLIVVPGSVQYSAASTGFALGPGGTGGRTVVFEIPNAPTTGAVQIHFDYSSSNNGNTTNDGPVFSIGTTAAAGTQIANYSNTASPAWVGDVSTTSRTIAFDYTTSGATVNVSNIVDPIILDLGARGIALSNTVSFDMDADGHAQGVAWTNGEDGILAVDLNGDGRIDSGREILSPWFNGGGFAHSLDALASLDSTGDGVLDANDVAFGALRVWVDANSNGITDAGELLSLSDLGITAINLATIAGSGAIDGQNVLANGSFSYADGTTGNFAAVELTETVNTRVFNGQGTEDVIGTAGDDLLFAGGLGNAMSAEAGNDVLYSGAGNDRLSGGDGGDRFVLASSGADTITDYAPGDTIDITSVLNVAGDTDVIAGGYLRITTTGLVQVDSDGGGDNWVTIANVNLGPASYAIAYGSGDSVRTIEVAPVAPPIGIDMDGDGQVSFLGTDAGVTFDYGYGKVATAWVAGNDGILVRDANHDGQASADEVVFATTGSDLDGLAIYDSNHDGQLSAADAGFADFRVWQDGNSNGIVEAGEMTSLTALGIAGISLTSDRIGFSAAGGDVEVVGTGSYTRSDGSTGVLADAVFTTGARAGDEQLRVTGALASNAGLVGAVAAAGLMAVPVHAEVRPVDGREVQPLGEQHLSLAPQPSASERVENNHALQGEAKVAPDAASTAMLSHDDLRPGWHASDPLSASDSGEGAPHFSDLLGGTSAADPAAQPPVAAASLMVSAEMLQAAMAAVAHQGAGNASPHVADTGSEQIRGVLLDALASHSHGKPDVDSLLNAVAGAHQGHGENGHGAIGPVLADAYAQVHFAMHAEPLAEMMALHAAAPLHG